MPAADAWNHVNYCVPPAHVAALMECIETLFPWSVIVKKPTLVGYRLGEDLNQGALYLRPTAAATTLHGLLAALRAERPELDDAFTTLAAQEADLNDHQGFRVASVAEWEARVARARDLAARRPELGVSVVRVERPGDAGAPTDYLYQAWIRLALLGPFRNTFEMQAYDPAKVPVR